MEEPLFKGIETTSNHGTIQGIIPRFFLQMDEMAKIALPSKEERDKKFGHFFKNNISDFTDFYDTFHDIKSLYNDYVDGLKDGRYYSIDDRGSFNHDRSEEFILKKKIREFYIYGRLLLNNFAKSHIIDDDYIVLNDLLLVNDNNFERNKDKFLKMETEVSYKILFKIIQDARKEFLTDFNQIRADFEHRNIQIPKFQVKVNNDKVEIIEPMFDKHKLIDVIEFFYNRMLDFIELLMAFYLGIQSYKRTKGFMTLYKRKTFDQTQLIYEYVIMPKLLTDNNFIMLIK